MPESNGTRLDAIQIGDFAPPQIASRGPSGEVWHESSAGMVIVIGLPSIRTGERAAHGS